MVVWISFISLVVATVYSAYQIVKSADIIAIKNKDIKNGKRKNKQ
jgi:hypothetical protein